MHDKETPPDRHASLNRRDWIKRFGAAGLALGLPPLIAGCGGDGDDAPPEPEHEQRTLFFNLSHLAAAETTHHVYIAGRRHTLTKVSDKPGVLLRARRTNAFLRGVADDQITHHVEAATIPGQMVSLAYASCNENPQAGTWEMSGTFFTVPTEAVVQAYNRARMRTPQGPLPLSGKRRRYKLQPAASAQDLRDEQALVDTTSFAEALVGVHPDLLSVEPASGTFILTNYVSQDSNTQFLGDVLQGMGPAVPQGMTSVSGLPPWGTLMPLVNEQTQQPFKKSDGQLNQYYPDWDPVVEQNVGPAVTTVHPLLKDDESLGSDITGFNLNDPNNPVPPEQLNGTLWARHDGVATIDQPASIGDADGPVVQFVDRGPDTGLYVSQPDVQTLGDGRVQVTLDNVSNWFLRYLGMWVQFIEADGVTVIQASQLPADTFPAEPGPYPRAHSLDKSDALFLGVVSPAVAVLGLPVYPGQFAPTLRIPKAASTMRIFYAGLGQAGSIPADPAGIIGVGTGMTAAFNYGVVGLFMAAGVSTYGVIFKLVVSIGGGTVAAAVASLIGGLINESNFGRGLLSFTMGFVKIMWQTGGSKAITEIAEAIALQLAAAQYIDSIPAAGQIARAVAAAVGAIQLAETSIEVGISPAVYQFDVVQSHDLSVTIKPDAGNTQFPQPPAGHKLYYKVSYLFDHGTAHMQDAVDVPDPTVKTIPITFQAVPRGGQVNIVIGFYMRQSGTPAGQNDWCAAHGSTGLVDNNVDQAPDLTIVQVKTPILSTTQYLHTRIVTLDGNGNHVWTADGNGSLAPPYVAPGGSNPGLNGFNSITVRQATSDPPQAGYVGYAWNAASTGVIGCGNNQPGRFDQFANLNTDASNGGINAQQGYVTTTCGLNLGVRAAYDLLGREARNIYVDTMSRSIRRVQLDPPSIDGSGSGNAYGVLNLDSTRCLLHPSGHIVSINNEFHKLEALRLPSAPVADDQAQKYYLARTYSGQGTRPGLITLPVAAAISPDGVILVLEDGGANNRIQAFDIGGNPMPFFKQQAKPYFLTLDSTDGATYLDLAVEFTGYLYVLSKDVSNNHRLDIYHPSQTGTQPLATTLNINAANLTVDFWRDVYTLNYQVLTVNGSIPGFTEPSVSVWVPTPPQG